MLYELQPPKSAFLKHFHKYNTENFYIISVIGKVETRDKELELKSGDVIVFQCGETGTHNITNTSEKEKLIIYINFDTANYPDIIKYVDFRKIGLMEHNISSFFYKKDITMKENRGGENEINTSVIIKE